MKPVVIFGAGSIGCYVAARLAASGTPVHLVGRPSMGQTLSEYGLHASDYQHGEFHAQMNDVQFSNRVEADFPDTDLVLVCVKSAATGEAAATLRGILQPGTCIISLQNGLNNAQQLVQALPDHTVLAGMVPFNVVNQGKGHFHQGSEGQLEVQQNPAIHAHLGAFDEAGLAWLQHPDMKAVLWSKLLLNLNNAINALSGLPLKEELSQHAYRHCLAAAQKEALGLIRMADIRLAKIIALPSPWIPYALDVPDWLFRLLGNKMLAIDPQARSSMWEDLQQGRSTEIEWLNGEILKLAERLQHPAPINQKLVEMIRRAENGGRRDWSGPELRNALNL